MSSDCGYINRWKIGQWRPCLRTYLLLVRFHDAKKIYFFTEWIWKKSNTKTCFAWSLDHAKQTILEIRFIFFDIFASENSFKPTKQNSKFSQFFWVTNFWFKICYLPMRTQYLHAYTQRMFCNFYFNFVRIHAF